MSGLGKMIRSIRNQDTIIKYRHDPWVAIHGDDAFPMWVADIIRDLLATPPRVRTASFSGSAAGMCLRRQELAYAGAQQEPVDFQLQSIFTDGKFRHLRWQAWLLTQGIITDIEYLVQLPEAMSRGSLDGRGEVPMNHPHRSWRGLEFGFELKGVSSFQLGKYKTDGPDDKHIRQVHHYFILGGFDLFSIVYEDKNTQNSIEWVVEPDPAIMALAEKDIWELRNSVASKVLHAQLPECVRKKGSWATCPYGKNKACLTATSIVPSPYVHSM